MYFTGRCTNHFSGDWDVHWGYDLDFDPWPCVLPMSLPLMEVTPSSHSLSKSSGRTTVKGKQSGYVLSWVLTLKSRKLALAS